MPNTSMKRRHRRDDEPRRSRHHVLMNSRILVLLLLLNCYYGSVTAWITIHPPLQKAHRRQRHAHCHHHSQGAIAAPATTTCLRDMEESEWYSPPPPPPPSSSSRRPRLARHAQVHVTQVTGEASWQRAVLEQDGFVVIKFYASWCKSCQKFGLLLHNHIGVPYGVHVHKTTGETLQAGELRLVYVEWGDNTGLCQRLGITKLPTTALYYHGRQVARIDVGPSNFDKVKFMIEAYLEKSPDELHLLADLSAAQDLLRQDGAMDNMENITTPTPQQHPTDAAANVMDKNLQHE